MIKRFFESLESWLCSLDLIRPDEPEDDWDDFTEEPE